MVEIFGARGQDLTYPEMKWWTDHMQVSGVNFMIPHSFNPRSPYDSDCPPYFYNGGFEPRWPLYRVYADYTSRLSLMLTGGRHVCPVALLFGGNMRQVGKAVTPEDMTTALQDAPVRLRLAAVSRCSSATAALRGKEIQAPQRAIPRAGRAAGRGDSLRDAGEGQGVLRRGGMVVGYGFLPSKSATIGKTSADIAALCRAIWGDDAKPASDRVQDQRGRRPVVSAPARSRRPRKSRRRWPTMPACIRRSKCSKARPTAGCTCCTA